MSSPREKGPTREEHTSPCGAGKWYTASCPHPRAFYLHMTFGFEDGPHPLRNSIAKPSSLHLYSGRWGCDPTTGQLKGFGSPQAPYLWIPGGQCSFGPTTSFLWRKVGAGLREETDQHSLFSAERPPGLMGKAKDQLFPCLALEPPGTTGNGVHHGEAPFPYYLHPMFPALERGEPNSFCRLSRVTSAVPRPRHRFCLPRCLPAPGTAAWLR